MVGMNIMTIKKRFHQIYIKYHVANPYRTVSQSQSSGLIGRQLARRSNYTKTRQYNKKGVSRLD